MILPNNGKVVVFDDDQKEIESLLRALSKVGIPFLYYQDELGSDLPDQPIDNIRLVFLDLELAINNPDKHNIIAPIAARLKRVLTKNNTYILVYWSTKEQTYKDVLEKAFETNLKEYKPIKILSLNKVQAKLSENPAKFVEDALVEEMKEFHSLNAFMLWESSVNNSAGKITNNLTTIFAKDSGWDKKIHTLLFDLARAQAGRDSVKDLDNNARLAAAFDLINSNLMETVEKRFEESLHQITLNEIKEGNPETSNEEKSKINTKLHLNSSTSFKHFYSGNLYVQDINGTGREIIKKNIKDGRMKDLVSANTKLVCLDITPSCDYSQNKNYTRILYGIIIDGKIFSKKDLRDGDFIYRECPIMDIEQCSLLFFDFRYLKSFPKDVFQVFFKNSPKFRLRNNLLLDIQAQLASHVNRPGIVSVF